MSESSALRPPKIQRLSHSANGEVLQRRKCLSSGLNATQGVLTSKATLPDTSLIEPLNAPYFDAIPWYAKREDLLGGGCMAPNNSNEQVTPSSTPETSQSTDPLYRANDLEGMIPADMLTAVKQNIMMKRKRRRDIQRRYRRRLRDNVVGLEEDVLRLKDEVQELAEKQKVLLNSSPRKNTSWGVVVEYWHLFRKGFKSQSDVQKTFLQAVMSPDVSVNSGFGVGTHLEEWRRMTLHLDDLNLCLLRLEYRDDDTLVASVRGTTTMTEAMLRNKFPHLLNGKWSTLGLKLLGQQLEVSAMMRFVWDELKARIVSVHHIQDLETPLLKLLGSLEDVSYVLKKQCKAV